MELLAPSPPAWIQKVMTHFDHFLLDHASAERKASAMATSFVVQYPDKYALHIPLIRLAREELLHYQQVMRLVHRRKLIWERDVKDPYIQHLLTHLSTDRRLRLLDRLLMGGMVEARGVERFSLVAHHLEDAKLQSFYENLARSEANHAELFPSLAAHYFDHEEIASRQIQWQQWEQQAMEATPIRAALH